MSTVLQEFMSLLVGGIETLATGIASGIIAMVKGLFLEVDATTHAVTGLSVFGGVVAIFCSIALAVGITTRVYLWVTSLGKN